MNPCAKGQEEPDYTRLFSTYAKGCSGLVAFASGANVSAQARDRRTILFDACGRNDAEAVRHLLFLGGNVNHQDEEGLMPLHMAAIHYAVDADGALLTAGADVNAQDQYRNMPLFRAVSAFSWRRVLSLTSSIIMEYRRAHWLRR